MSKTSDQIKSALGRTAEVAEVALNVVGHSVLPVPTPLLKMVGKDVINGLKPTPENIAKEKTYQQENGAIKKQAMKDFYKDMSSNTSQLAAQGQKEGQFLRQSAALYASYAVTAQFHNKIAEQTMFDDKITQALADSDFQVELQQGDVDSAMERQTQALESFNEQSNVIISDGIDKVMAEQAEPDAMKAQIQEAVNDLSEQHQDSPEMAMNDYATQLDQAAQDYVQQLEQSIQMEADKQSLLTDNPYYADPKAALKMPNPDFF